MKKTLVMFFHSLFICVYTSVARSKLKVLMNEAEEEEEEEEEE